jgi:hypothetical protein
MKARLSIALVTIAVLLGGISAEAGNVKVDLNIILDPYRPVIVRKEVYRPPVPVRSAPEPEHSRRDEVRFIYPDELGFYVAIGVPYELCYIDRSYYLFRDGRWLRAYSRRGPWVAMNYRELPVGLRQHRIERIRDYRQYGYASHRERGRDRDWKDHKDLNGKGNRSGVKEHERY